ncbi:MAG: hypothetical protein LBB24_01590 [Rickettsiales bacterium]|jgi:hypothetical protein|nr:hypothetical protein [Rickettsiales bacterium]
MESRLFKFFTVIALVLLTPQSARSSHVVTHQEPISTDETGERGNNLEKSPSGQAHGTNKLPDGGSKNNDVSAEINAKMKEAILESLLENGSLPDAGKFVTLGTKKISESKYEYSFAIISVQSSSRGDSEEKNGKKKEAKKEKKEKTKKEKSRRKRERRKERKRIEEGNDDEENDEEEEEEEEEKITKAGKKRERRKRKKMEEKRKKNENRRNRQRKNHLVLESPRQEMQTEEDNYGEEELREEDSSRNEISSSHIEMLQPGSNEPRSRENTPISQLPTIPEDGEGSTVIGPIENTQPSPFRQLTEEVDGASEEREEGDNSTREDRDGRQEGRNSSVQEEDDGMAVIDMILQTPDDPNFPNFTPDSTGMILSVLREMVDPLENRLLFGGLIYIPLPQSRNNFPTYPTYPLFDFDHPPL